MEVRLSEAQGCAKTQQPIFCFSPTAKLLNFHSAAGGARKRQFFCPAGAVAQKR